MPAEPTERDDRIAVVGMAGRFPKAATLAAFWQNLREGVESLSFYSEEELRAMGVPQAFLDDPTYVRAQAMLEALDRFDAPFFGFTPREAEITNPQNRLFLECCWEAFEDAGIDPGGPGGPGDPGGANSVGVFAGASSNTYILDLFSRHDLIRSVGGARVQISNEKEFLPTWVSYKLDLRGPSVNVQTACSSSLVAVHMAVQSLLNGECDLALAGGVSVRNLERGGYFFVEGAILSPDGHCRAFDASGGGTVNGDGAGVVLLKRFADAKKAGDNVRALILGSAVNNDGARKVGFTAPSEEGQTRVISEALSIAGIDAETLGYVEAHGTGTRLGDPIEIAALSAALRAKSSKRGFCAVGSVKTNLGHLDAGAGVAGLIKTVLALEHRTLPPSLHFGTPNPEIDFATSPVYVNTAAKPWESTGTPRRAGVSSFGIGGTNAHVILEEAPELTSGPSRGHQLLVWSARSPAALDAMTGNLAAALGEDGRSLPDAAFTLAVGRRAFEHRRALVATDAGEAASLLADPGAERIVSGQAPAARPVAFLFPGQGAQKTGATRALYETEKVFRQEIDRAAEILEPLLGEDLRRLLYPEDGAREETERRLAETVWAQPAVFVVGHALARLWMSWGVRPQALLGHSLGEYVAATLAGVLSLEDALALVALRGKLMQDLPQGAMLAVPLGEAAVGPLLGPDLSLAAVNAAQRTVVSGPKPAIEELLEKRLAARGLEGKLLRTSHAFHSAMMEPMIPAFGEKLRAISLDVPKIPYVSNVTGDWITGEQATDPAFWLRQLREPVRFAEGAATLLGQRDWALLEVGPGRTLYQLLLQHPERRPGHRAVGSLARTSPTTPENAALLEALASLWVSGVEVDWKAFYRGERRRKVSLPTYPFERQRYFIERAAGAAAAPWTELAARQGMTANLEEGAMALKEGMDLNLTEALSPSPSPATGEGDLLPTEIQTPARRVLLEMLKNLVHELSGMDPASFDPKASFLDIGVDSLMMIQATQKLREQVGVKLTVVQLLEELPTLESLAAHLEREMAPEKLAELVPQEPVPLVQAADRTDRSDPSDRSERSSDEPVSAPLPAASYPLPAFTPAVATGAEANALTNLFAQQLQILSQQLQVLQGANLAASLPPSIEAPSARPSPAGGSVERAGSETTHVREAGAGASAPERSAAGTPQGRDSEPPAGDGRALPQAPAAPTAWTQFGPYHPIPVSTHDTLDARQRAYLDRFIRRYTARTAKSKELTEAHRRHLADGRATVSFRRLWKEIVYPIHSHSSAGSRITDVDGNEYVDINMGFGLHFFGHSPDFLVEALDRQLRQGIEVGPQPVLAGQAADLLCQLTGMDRAMFCTSGTEAILGALRVARTVTGRNKVVVLSDSWHGWSDSTVVRRPPAGRLGAVPGAPGISPRTLEEIVVLEFGTPETLAQIEALGPELAAVLVEPVRSRWPEVQSGEFLHALRRLTRASGTALIFDEIVTGFRIHPGGAQAHFGVEADLATYGKLLGGGLPIGVLAGRDAFMNALDGGPWHFGDDSYPAAEKTLFTGTFFKHPLALAAAHAVLLRIQKDGLEPYERLNARTALLVADLSAYFQAASVPIDVVGFGSLFRFRPRKEMKHPELFYFHLVDHGIYYTQESGNCFLTAAHSEADIARIQRAVELSVEDLTEGGFLAEAHAVPMPGLDIAHAGTAAAPTKAAPVLLTGLDGPPDGQPLTVLELPVPDNQRVIWIACKMGPAANRSYNEPLALRFRGPLHFAALHAAAQEVSNRHQALRASFNAEGSLLRIRSRRHVPLPLIDYSGLPEAARGPEMDWCLKYLAGLAFDLEEGPLMRVAVTKWAPGDHYLSLTAHHIVIDGPSAGVMVRELALLYGAYSRGETADLINPGSLEGWVWRTVARKETDPDQQEAEVYFRQLFLEPVELIDLPLDRPRPRSVPFWGDRRRYFMEPELVAALKRLGNTYRATPFAVVLAAFGAMLHELTQQEKIIVGIPSRDPSVSGAMVGYYINLLPVRMFRDPGETYATRLGKVRKTLFELQTHQSYPLNRLLEKLGLAGGLDGFLVGTTFNHEKMDASPPMPGLEADVVWVYHDAARIDLHLNVIEDGKTGSGLLEFAYKTTFMDAASVDRWLKSLVSVLRQVANDPQTDLRQLPLLDPADRQQLVVEWNDTEDSGLPEATLHQLFEAQAAKDPAAPAVSLGTADLSYGDLEQLSSLLAGHLAALGVGPDVKVGLSLDRSFELIVALLAILKAGGAYVPLEPTQPRERLLFLLEDSGAQLLLTRSWVTEKLGSGLADLGIRAFDVDEDWPESEPPALDRPPLPDSLAYVIYTSGSTGKPNGVGVSHRSAVNLVRQMEEPFRVTPESRIAMIASFGFDVSVFEVFTSFAYGACLCLIRDEELGNPTVLADRLAKQKVTTAFATPSRLSVLPDGPLGGLVNLGAGGEALNAEVVNKWSQGRRLINCYGPTETTIYSTIAIFEDATLDKAPPIGRPIGNLQNHIVNRDLQPIPLGAGGQLAIGGVGVGRGYLGRPDKTAAKFVPDPFAALRGEAGARLYLTGDRARFTTDGNIEYMGRSDDQIKLRGYRIELGEIESVLAASPGVRETAVAVRGQGTGEMLAAYVVWEEDFAERDLAPLKRAAEAQLPDYMVPAAWIELKELPKTVNGKIDRLSLRAKQQEAEVRPHVDPETPLEVFLVDLWKEVLHLDKLSLHDNFLELGGNSISAAMLAFRLQELVHENIHALVVFDAPTIADLARFMGERYTETVVKVWGEESLPESVRQALQTAQPPA